MAVTLSSGKYSSSAAKAAAGTDVHSSSAARSIAAYFFQTVFMQFLLFLMDNLLMLPCMIRESKNIRLRNNYTVIIKKKEKKRFSFHVIYNTDFCFSSPRLPDRKYPFPETAGKG
jgi:hypothetical protein